MERYLAELSREDGDEDVDELLPEWFGDKWSKAAAALRSAEGALSRQLGHRPSVAELREDATGLSAIGAIERLRAQRRQLLARVGTGGREGDGSGGGSGDERDGSAAAERNASPLHAERSPLFRGYSRELLRARQQLTRASEVADGGEGLQRGLARSLNPLLHSWQAQKVKAAQSQHTRQGRHETQ